MREPITSMRPVFSSKVVPVIVITDVDHAVPMAHALLEGGIDVMEVTLRHPAGMAAIEAIAKHVPHMQVGAGTVRHTDDIHRVQSAGARFALSPGFTDALVQAAMDARLPFIPGVMTPGELLRAQAHGFSLVKLFPAEQCGGLGMVKALNGPFADMQLCPTGGVSPANMQAYLREPNVAMVGGSWITPADAVARGDWAHITQLAQQAVALAA
ncbi:MAG: bifunctional 4-hydroxy-2-oxoglutarate aldolase/2-dehydro-3-deoxy-phosphogluconate aldolase [Burkholderiaceae bacterium]|jgi:2-dehydro-3-deoxyphosphogluconate aldolase/(4S)-4-hydroxy-2-oxoglutarate aldolase|nr:bifunctional 4-hydroxy-2-oxoglutarate aldolase/2-dehydro-3-deoxy-phosphogluconate aldolase [Burkholderiales bacterium]MCE2677438.1 bifunctional 4-hydroxy-2-oxoglutarate aldolase/2-dehydro-3-deoxy-phosphogluconate aldolase [Burkholderiaceae bacterium]